jgi:hypothetical protein
MKRGRPIKSEIRDNIIEILHYLGSSYGYRIAKIYLQLFPSCTREVIYYHLKKGVSLGEIELKEVKLEKGEYSWGSEVEKVYYTVGPKASPKGDDRIRQFVELNKSMLN